MGNYIKIKIRKDFRSFWKVVKIRISIKEIKISLL